ncbi:Hsp70 family protein, partial [Glycomyces tenuis]
LVPEPVAAATYFAESLGHRIAPGSSLVVYDLGAGTFDASVVRRTEHGFETVALDGRGDLGGLDIDAAIVDHLAKTYGEHEGWLRLTNPGTVEERRAFRDFQEEIRGAKERLSRHQQADLAIPLLEVEAHLTRTELEQIAAPHLERTIHVTRAVLRAAGLEAARSAGVFLVGGASRMPLVATMLHRALGVAPTVLDQPEVVVAEGSVRWTEPTRPSPPPVTPHARPRPQPPVTPQIMPQAAPVTPQRHAPLSPPSAPTSPSLTGPPPSPQERAAKQRRARRIIAAVIAVNVLLIAALVYVFRPDAEADDAPTLSDSLAEAATFDRIGPVIEAHEGAVTSMAAVSTEDGPALFTTGADKTVTKWDLETGEAVDSVDFAYSTEFLGLTALSDGRSVLVAMDTEFGFYAWDPESFEYETLHEGQGYSDLDEVERDALGTNEGNATYAVMYPTHSYLWDLENGTAVTGDIEFDGDQLASLRNYAVFGDRIGLVTVDAEGGLRLYETRVRLDTGLEFEEADDWSADDAPESLGVVSIDGTPHAMVLSRGRYFIWDLESGAFTGSAEWEGDLDANFASAAVTVDGAPALLAHDDDSQGAVLDLYSGTELAALADEDDDSNLVTDTDSVVVDGYTIAVTGYADGTVRLWNLGS